MPERRERRTLQEVRGLRHCTLLLSEMPKVRLEARWPQGRLPSSEQGLNTVFKTTKTRRGEDTNVKPYTLFPRYPTTYSGIGSRSRTLDSVRMSSEATTSSWFATYIAARAPIMVVTPELSDAGRRSRRSAEPHMHFRRQNGSWLCARLAAGLNQSPRVRTRIGSLYYYAWTDPTATPDPPPRLASRP